MRKYFNILAAIVLLSGCGSQNTWRDITNTGRNNNQLKIDSASCELASRQRINSRGYCKSCIALNTLSATVNAQNTYELCMQSQGWERIEASAVPRPAEQSPEKWRESLWSATLETLSFMPLSSTNQSSGIIITDWYEASNARGERFKVSAVVSSDGVKINVLKQIKQNGNWHNTKVTPSLAHDLENVIMIRAKQKSA